MFISSKAFKDGGNQMQCFQHKHYYVELVCAFHVWGTAEWVHLGNQ